ncbi:unnamed protein product [Clonostachys rhizophaga]|uniref:Zn(2)-C6 fungal-type domain-containing protein n=1 Tax=Clonostachys rhizophaga TaxID=160324 RepID=A0A9N9VYA3_9HYPO|nr:unnamed protein product [Clonostachys rhizophaga]
MTSIRRKWHVKSRNGCDTCKMRKIKCDELHPECWNCIKKGLRCNFKPLRPMAVKEPPDIELEHLEHLELLHHFTISTASTLANESEIRDLWRVWVPQIALSVRYVLEGILALAALHKARYNPERRESLEARAMEYHNASLARALPLVTHPNRHNGAHLFLFGVLTLLFSLAKPRTADDIFLVGSGVVPEWLYLLRGIDTVIEAESAIEASPISLIFRATNPSFEYWRSHEPVEHGALTALKANIRARAQASNQKTLLDAVEALQRSFTIRSRDTLQFQHKMRGFYTWLYDISDEYLKLLRQGDCEALCVLAFYSVLLKDLERHWWLEGWAVHLLQRIYLLLDEEHQLWIRWPVEEVGWVPPCVPSVSYQT